LKYLRLAPNCSVEGSIPRFWENFPVVVSAAREYYVDRSISALGGIEMSLQDRLESLRARHASLEQAILQETNRPLPNNDAIGDLKRQKLRIKDEIFALEKQH
jgi:hypothetical protein